MSRHEIWAVPYKKICEFFIEQPGMISKGCGKFERNDIRITAVPLPEKKIGPLSFPQTDVFFEGNDTEKVYKAFCLRFLSAGG